MSILCAVCVLCGLLPLALSMCYDPFPVYPVPEWTLGGKDSEELAAIFPHIENKLQSFFNESRFNTWSYALEITSNTDPLWTSFRTSQIHNPSRPGVKTVNGDSQFRIASITKTFTVHGILYQHQAGNLRLDDTVDQYIPELNDQGSATLPWTDITLRALASQLSGIPRDFALGDAVNYLPDPTQFGLPPINKSSLLSCGEYTNFQKPCTKADLFGSLRDRESLFAPNFESSYSNIAFVLLGLVIENVTGMSYSDYIQEAIFRPLGMSLSSLEKPSDDRAVLPAIPNSWDWDFDVYRPAGAIYSSSTDMSKYIRFVLTHYNALATGVNWMNPTSWSGGMNSFYGMPWEIFRTDRLLMETRRPVTFITKAGGVPGYYSLMTLLPDYGLGMILLTAGDDDLVTEITDVVSLELVRVAEATIWRSIDRKYSGKYGAIDSSLNSSATVSASPSRGLELINFISNGTDVLASLTAFLDPGLAPHTWRAQLNPTLRFKNAMDRRGEIWRMQIVPKRKLGGEDQVWNDVCHTDWDGKSYAGLPINEIVFWHDDGLLELPAWKLKMSKRGDETNLFEQHL